MKRPHAYASDTTNATRGVLPYACPILLPGMKRKPEDNAEVSVPHGSHVPLSPLSVNRHERIGVRRVNLSCRGNVENMLPPNHTTPKNTFSPCKTSVPMKFPLIMCEKVDFILTRRDMALS